MSELQRIFVVSADFRYKLLYGNYSPAESIMTDPSASENQGDQINRSSQICPVCDGKGIVKFTAYKECSICEGTGSVQGEPCPSCHGTAPVYEIESVHACPACNGKAFI